MRLILANIGSLPFLKNTKQREIKKHVDGFVACMIGIGFLFIERMWFVRMTSLQGKGGFHAQFVPNSYNIIVHDLEIMEVKSGGN